MLGSKFSCSHILLPLTHSHGVMYATRVASFAAQVTIEYGGSDDHVILIIVLRCLTDSLSLMVTDAKGRISFANSQLAQLLGYNARTLTDGMNMAALLPPPYAQIHAGYMKVGNRGRDLEGGCRDSKAFRTYCGLGKTSVSKAICSTGCWPTASSSRTVVSACLTSCLLWHATSSGSDDRVSFKWLNQPVLTPCTCVCLLPRTCLPSLPLAAVVRVLLCT